MATTDFEFDRNQKIGGGILVGIVVLTLVSALALNDTQFAAISFTLYYAAAALLVWLYRPALYTRGRLSAAVIGLAVLVVGAILELFFPASPVEAVFGILNVNMFEQALRISVPIALAALGGLYAEKSGVFNIGLEGFLIFGAFIATAVAFLAAGGSVGGSGFGVEITQLDLWIGVLAAVLITAGLTALFAVAAIRYKANQIVAGLAVWFMGLGFAPFGASVIWGQVNSPPLGTINEVSIPGLSQVPYAGPVLFEATPMTIMTWVIVIVLWYALYYTRWGYWVQAAGENPEALDTAGVNVNRVRYAAVILSGALCGLGGAALSVGFTAQFIGKGVTMVDGRGWIAITAYLFGNYNPLGAFGASLLFGGVDAFQIRLQNLGYGIPGNLVGLFPYVAVLIVLTFYGTTRMPASVGEAYETEED